jgi:hypothetical protein
VSFALALFSAVVCGLILTAFAQMKQSVCAGLKKVVAVWSANSSNSSILAEPSREVQHALLVLGVIGFPHKSKRLMDDHVAWYSDDGVDNISELRSFVFVHPHYDGTTLIDPLGECFHKSFGIHKHDSASARARRQDAGVLELPEKRQHKIGELSW